MYYIRHIQNSGIFRTLFIQAYSRIVSIIKAYSRLFIFRLIKAYSAPFITYAYSQPFLVPGPSMFRTGGIFKTL